MSLSLHSTTLTDPEELPPRLCPSPPDTERPMTSNKDSTMVDMPILPVVPPIMNILLLHMDMMPTRPRMSAMITSQCPLLLPLVPPRRCTTPSLRPLLPWHNKVKSSRSMTRCTMVVKPQCNSDSHLPPAHPRECKERHSQDRHPLAAQGQRARTILRTPMAVSKS